MKWCCGAPPLFRPVGKDRAPVHRERGQGGPECRAVEERNPVASEVQRILLPSLALPGPAIARGSPAGNSALAARTTCVAAEGLAAVLPPVTLSTNVATVNMNHVQHDAQHPPPRSQVAINETTHHAIHACATAGELVVWETAIGVSAVPKRRKPMRSMRQDSNVWAQGV